MYNYSNECLTKKQIESICPSAFATMPHKNVSDKYVMIHTESIINSLENFGYYPVTAKESNTRKEENMGTQMHTIRFRKPEHFNIEVNDLAPEFVWVNSHNGRTRAKGMFGIFRKVCSNGLTVSDSLLSNVNSKHIGIEEGEIEELIDKHIIMADEVLSQIDNYKKVKLSLEERYSFAKQAKQAIWQNNTMNAEQLLTPRRKEDISNDLFTTFNVVQENITKGGIEYTTPKRKVKTRGIKSIQKDIDTNLMLWTLLHNTYVSEVTHS